MQTLPHLGLTIYKLKLFIIILLMLAFKEFSNLPNLNYKKNQNY